MRIERIRVDAFGALSGLDTGPASLGPLVVVLGPNEAGKSTLFSFLTTALYGFHPATREKNPHVPWGADEASGRVQLRLDEAECVTVERRLRSGPSGTLTSEGAEVQLRNQALPWVEHVPRAVFGQVFAITLGDLAGLDTETWAGIQDRIVGSMGSSDIGSARAVADVLEREASEIWRPNRRGNQRLRELQETIRALRGRRNAALERDREIRALVEERGNLQVRLRETRELRQEHRIAVEHVQTLLPVRRQLGRIDALRAQGGPIEELRRLPTEPVERLRALRDEQRSLQARVAQLEEEIEDPESVLARFGPSEQALVAHAEEVTGFVTMDAQVAPDRHQVRSLGGELADTRVKLEAAGEQMLDGGWAGSHGHALAGISVALLRDRIERLDRMRAASGTTPTTEDSGSTKAQQMGSGRAAVTIAHAISLIAGAALASWATLLGGPRWAAALGAALATAGALGLWMSRGARRDARGADAMHQDEARRQRMAELDREIDSMVSGLPVRGSFLSPAAEPLASGLERLQRLAGEEAERARALEAAQARAASVDAAAHALAAALGRRIEGPTEAVAALLDRELREAERLREAASAAERELRRLARERDEARRRLDEVTGRLTALGEDLAKLGGGSVDRAAQEAGRRIRAHARADQLADELERAHADLPALVQRIRSSEAAGEAWTRDDSDLVERRARMDELDDQVEHLIAEIEALDRNVAHLREEETVDAVDSEIVTLQEAETRLIRERDRKWVLGGLVREADRRFREEHQPDLIRRAGEHLGRLTAGRYDRLLVDETRPDGPFQLLGPRLPTPIPLAAPISTGTLEQAYLSLRLAIVDHLDPGPRRLPIFLDEAFVNWDLTRRERGLDVLADLSAGRQTFVFTCHPEMAEHLRGRGARILTLERAP